MGNQAWKCNTLPIYIIFTDFCYPKEFFAIVDFVNPASLGSQSVSNGKEWGLSELNSSPSPLAFLSLIVSSSHPALPFTISAALP